MWWNLNTVIYIIYKENWIFYNQVGDFESQGCNGGCSPWYAKVVSTRVAWIRKFLPRGKRDIHEKSSARPARARSSQLESPDSPARIFWWERHHRARRLATWTFTHVRCIHATCAPLTHENRIARCTRADSADQQRSRRSLRAENMASLDD